MPSKHYHCRSLDYECKIGKLYSTSISYAFVALSSDSSNLHIKVGDHSLISDILKFEQSELPEIIIDFTLIRGSAKWHLAILQSKRVTVFDVSSIIVNSEEKKAEQVDDLIFTSEEEGTFDKLEG